MKWPTVQLGQVATIVGGSTPSRNIEEYWNGTVCWLTPTDLPMPGEGIADVTETVSKITEKGLSAISAKLLPVGTVLFSSRATIGKLGISRVPLVTNQGFANLIPKSSVDAKYLSYCLLYFSKNIIALSGSTTFKEVTKTSLKKFKIPLPPISEQRRIVEILDQADRLRRLRADADAKAARILPALFYKMFGDPATSPKGWPVKRLDDPQVATINPRFADTSVSDDMVFSFVPMADVEETWGRIIGRQVRPYSEVKRGFTPFQNDDVLFAKITPCMQNGKAAIARNLIHGRGFGSTEFHVLRAGPAATPEWLFALVRLSWFRKQAESSFTGTVGQQRVPADFLERYKVACPPIELQRKFANAVIQLFNRSDQADRSKQAIDRLFATLLHRAFNGDLTGKWRKAHMKELLDEVELQNRLLSLSKN
jgi:type I restriction enzyme S subunit